MTQAEKLTWSTAQNDDKMALRLIGELSRDTLLPLWQQRFAVLSDKQIARQNVIFDLSTITRMDSAGFALLCDLIHQVRRVQEPDKTLTIEHAPSQLLTLAELFDLDQWLSGFLQTH
ncbi:STAS domain-containing protein [Bisgaard Taxon 10/6]|uniref:STAS domain-containing protein n=1 Tax=Exercitatus varius TaxID=67857 RepID=A0AAW6Q8N0_9PAST|nr:STAS domain-containing protein [Exercitatus varius]MDG2943138.1 STAS domain-containing protein [Exercitatus varius]MDG2947516.1 STAS domain-containing protein [Exercitatus varius]MDG2949944.1 STAS domain-containing protein [Exercitatus varius]MDG2957207.1 STAS domain-containing protein [Exercitatus varius]MDG2960952.1 STAS domain-containing protein [Exercitatus varius]